MSHGSSNSHGVAILIKKCVDYTLHSKFIDALGRYIILKAEIKDKIYVLINIYAPNKDKDRFKFFADLLTRLKNENLDQEENVIIGGDFNYLHDLTILTDIIPAIKTDHLAISLELNNDNQIKVS